MITSDPDCRNGKHRSCSGAGWDETKDQPTDCPCNCHKGKTMNQREELALEIFIADNSNQPREQSIQDWEVYRSGHQDFTYTHSIADGLIAAGYRKPRTITTVKELDALPEGSVIRFIDIPAKVVAEKNDEGVWQSTNGYDYNDWEYPEGDKVNFPATVLYDPSDGAQ